MVNENSFENISMLSIEGEKMFTKEQLDIKEEDPTIAIFDHYLKVLDTPLFKDNEIRCFGRIKNLQVYNQTKQELKEQHGGVSPYIWVKTITPVWSKYKDTMYIFIPMTNITKNDNFLSNLEFLKLNDERLGIKYTNEGIKQMIYANIDIHLSKCSEDKERCNEIYEGKALYRYRNGNLYYDKQRYDISIANDIL